MNEQSVIITAYQEQVIKLSMQSLKTPVQFITDNFELSENTVLEIIAALIRKGILVHNENENFVSLTKIGKLIAVNYQPKHKRVRKWIRSVA